VGISFYTFQTLSYTIDLYRAKVTTERSLLNFALYVAFFPQLVAGPIERARNLLPQMRSPRTISWERLYTGFYLICWGLFKKVVIADNVAKVADTVFTMQQPTAGAVLIGVYAFAIQIYCDFSAYSDIARGTARCMGFDLMLNFNLPYLAPNPREFWRRWHISLSTWLRDYLYVPLGGNRRGVRRTYANLMIVMLLGGLWHGAGMTFVLWGLFHGLLLSLHRALKPWLDRNLNPRGRVGARLWKAVGIVFFFHLVCAGWLLFRAPTLLDALRMCRSALANVSLSVGLDSSLNLTFASCALVMLVVQLTQYRRQDLNVVFRVPAPVRAALYAAAMLGFVFFGEYGGDAFIYFQF
jgi:D-alanyl-lipoteichoic acid acyltransferase DltB (MBOAT superfamily)